jgi:hypothetical protein
MSHKHPALFLTLEALRSVSFVELVNDGFVVPLILFLPYLPSLCSYYLFHTDSRTKFMNRLVLLEDEDQPGAGDSHL